MKFGILCVGSHGDILPYIALGAKLKNKGHDVTIATHQKAESLCQTYNLEFAQVNGDLTELGNPQKMSEILSCRGLKKLAAFRYIMKLFKKHLKLQLESSAEAVKEVDVLIYSPAAFAGPHLAEYFKFHPFRMSLQPDIKSKEYSSCIVSLPKFLGKFGNLLTHILAEQMLWQPIRTQINRWRKEKLKIRKMHFFGPSHDPFSKKICTLVAFSPSLIRPSKDWGLHIHMTGFSRVLKTPKWLPPEELQVFLKKGPLPIYLGFGSLSETCPKSTVETIVKVLKKKKIRTLIQNTLPGITEMELPDHIFIIPYTPHDWLFSQVKAVVHHGGVGTTAAGLYAGKPTLVMPFLLDQFFWAKKILEWGVGPDSLPIKQCNEKTFESSVEKLLTTPSYQEKAEIIMGNLLKEKEGTEAAYQILSDVLLPK